MKITMWDKTISYLIGWLIYSILACVLLLFAGFSVHISVFCGALAGFFMGILNEILTKLIEINDKLSN